MLTAIKKKALSLLLAMASALQPKKYDGRKFAYTDNAGNNYYTREIASYHGSRRVALQAIIDQMGRGIDNETLVKLLSEASDHIMAGRKEQAIYALGNIKARTADVTNNSLLYRAALLCVLHEEEPEEYSAQWSAMKDAIWQKDEDARFFFMRWCLESFQGFQVSSDDAFRLAMQTLGLEKELFAKM